MLRKTHNQFISKVVEQLKSEGCSIIDEEVDIEVDGKCLRIDLLIEKEGQIIPVECGNIMSPKHERIAKIKKKYGNFLHIPYGNYRGTITDMEISNLRIVKEKCLYTRETLRAYINRLISEDMMYSDEDLSIKYFKIVSEEFDAQN